MRCFLAVDIDGELREKVIGLQKGLSGFDAKLVEKENLHFTLKFLGEVNEKTLEEIKGRVKQLANSFEPFEIDINGMGAFPNMNYIRVVWISAQQLFNLQKTVDDCLADLFGKEKDTTPHLTIARVRSARDKAELRDFIEKHRETKIGKMTVNEIKLKSSTLTRNGPVYEDVDVFRLVIS